MRCLCQSADPAKYGRADARPIATASLETRSVCLEPRGAERTRLIALCEVCGYPCVVTERILLMIGIVLLASGLGVWGIVADRDRPTFARTATPVAADLRAPNASRDGGPAELRALLERATMGHVPLIRLFDRASSAIYGIALPGRDAVEIVDRLRQVENTTHVPVVLGGEWDVRAHEDSARATMDPPSTIIERARHFDLDAWIARRLESVAGELRVASIEPWTPRGEERERFRLVRDPTLASPRTSVVIALLPARSSPDAPAWLAFGNWRGCPEPSVHVAMLTRWHERYGAELIGIGGDTIELRVTRPPSDRENAIALAREHVAYAPFLLAGGTRSIEDVATSIAGARVWSFRFARNSVSHR